MTVTIKTIAEFCKVSVGTVDRALNGRAEVNDETRERILQAAALLNYKPNRIAQSLALGVTKTIGIICFDLHNNFFSHLIDVIEAEAKKKGYFISLILTHQNIQSEWDGLRYLSERRVDGIIIFPICTGKEYIKYINSLKIPIVTIYNKLSDEFSHVGVNDYEAMKEAVQYLTTRGYQRVIYVTPKVNDQNLKNRNAYTLERRLTGYIDGLRISGLANDTVIVEGKNMEAIKDSISETLKTAILCVNDTYALDILVYLREKGYSAPDHVGIMGFDNVDVLKYVYPRLSTISYDVQKMGQTLFATLLKHFEGEKLPTECLLEYSIVEGETI